MPEVPHPHFQGDLVQVKVWVIYSSLDRLSECVNTVPYVTNYHHLKQMFSKHCYSCHKENAGFRPLSTHIKIMFHFVFHFHLTITMFIGKDISGLGN